MQAEPFHVVRRHWLFLIAGGVWTGVGILLMTRSAMWASELPAPTLLAFFAASILAAAAGYRFGFSKIVKMNIERIHSLPGRVSFFAFTGFRGYAMILLMIVLGIALRNSSIPKFYLSIPYASMGGVLLTGSVSLYREFIPTFFGNE